MCDPASVAMGGMSVFSAISGSSGAKKQARAKAEYNNRLQIRRNEQYAGRVEYQAKLADWQEDRYFKTVKSVQKSIAGQYAAVMEGVNAAFQRNSDQISKASRSSQQASSFIRASVAETGTTGNSVILAQQQAEVAKARYSYVGFENLKSQIRQSERTAAAMRARGQSQINVAMPAPMAPLDPAEPMQAVAKPPTMPYLLQAGQGVLGAYANHQSTKLAQQGMGLQKLQSGLWDATKYAAAAEAGNWT